MLGEGRGRWRKGWERGWGGKVPGEKGWGRSGGEGVDGVRLSFSCVRVYGYESRATIRSMRGWGCYGRGYVIDSYTCFYGSLISLISLIFLFFCYLSGGGGFADRM